MDPVDVVEYVFMSDTHVGRLTDDYNEEVFRDMVREFERQVQHSRNIATKSRMRVRRRHLVFLGDMVDGESIYPRHAYELEFGIDEQVLVFADAVGRMIRASDVVLAVPGNHGRSRKDGTGNWDRMLYLYLSEKYGGDGREFVLADGYKMRWTGPYGERFYLSHPAFVRMYQNIPYYGIIQDAMREYMLERFDYAVAGHFHTFFKHYFNGVLIYGVGTFLRSDELSKNKGVRPANRFLYLLIGSGGRVIFERDIDLSVVE